VHSGAFLIVVVLVLKMVDVLLTVVVFVLAAGVMVTVWVGAELVTVFPTVTADRGRVVTEVVVTTASLTIVTVGWAAVTTDVWPTTL
jgi:hypothetical protein